jgi:hypothetical protein
MAGSRPIEELRAEAHYHRQRYDLYRAKVYSLRPTRPARLAELERACNAAEARLSRAELLRADADAGRTIPK